MCNCIIMELCKCGIYEGSIEELTGKAALGERASRPLLGEWASRPLLTGIAAVPAAENTAAKMSAVPVMVTPEDIARGYRVESVVTNETPLAAMPSNAVEYAKWHLRGGYETWFPLDLGELVFPLGTNFVNRLSVISGGMVETYRALNGYASICAAREYASLIPGVSRFWSADADDVAKSAVMECRVDNMGYSGCVEVG